MFDLFTGQLYLEYDYTSQKQAVKTICCLVMLCYSFNVLHELLVDLTIQII